MANEELKSNSGILKNIGNNTQLSNTADPTRTINTRFQRFTNVIDMIPVNYTLDYNNISKTGDDAGKLVSLNFENAIGEYQDICQNYGLKRHAGIRLWTTGETTQQDEISNEFSENVIQQMINSFSTGNLMSSVRDFMHSAGVGTGGGSTVGELSRNIDSKTSSLVHSILQKTVSDSFASENAPWISSAINTFGAVSVGGEHINLPRIWKSSNYSPSLNVGVKLISPFGAPQAIDNFIANPLMYLLLLYSPRSTNGITYGRPPYVYIKAYGVSHMNLATIKSISIKRGGESKSFNVYKQPMILELNLVIEPAVNGFAAIQSNEKGKPSPSATLRDSLTKLNSHNELIQEIVNQNDSLNANALMTPGQILNSLRPAPSEITVVDLYEKREGLTNATRRDPIAEIKKNTTSLIQNLF